MSNLTIEQRLHNALGSQKVEEYKARHAYLHAIMYSKQEWDVFWHKSPNTTWAHQFGRMVGWEEVYYNSVVHTDANMLGLAIQKMQSMEEMWGHDFLSTGKSGCHALASDVIEVAEDGMSARAFYLTPGTMTGGMSMGLANGSVCRGGGWLWERYGSEFVFVDGAWKWFHEHVCPDTAGQYDVGNWAHDRYVDYRSGKLKIGDLGGYPDRLTEPGTLHYDYSIIQTVQDTVPPPLPYKTLNDENTYSPGRTDPTGKITVKTAGSQKMEWDQSDNYFDHALDDVPNEQTEYFTDVSVI